MGWNLDRERLVREVDFFHRRLFGGDPPVEVREQYVAAHQHLTVADPAAPVVDIEKIISRSLDPEGIEFWLRRRDPRNQLTRKFQIMFYLLEIRSDYYHYFIRDKGSLLTALPVLFHHLCRSLWKLARGFLQVRYHHVA